MMKANPGIQAGAARAVRGRRTRRAGRRWVWCLLAVVGLLLGARGLLLPAPELHEIKTRRGGGNWPTC